MLDSPESPSNAAATHLAPLRILLVEDIESNRDIFKLFLADAQHSIDDAENGRVAVEKFMSGAYDIIIMDIAMPVMDGAAATRVIREAEAASGLPRTPIVAISAHAFYGSETEIRQAGFDVFLPKPVSKKMLLQTIATYTNQASQSVTGACVSPVWAPFVAACEEEARATTPSLVVFIQPVLAPLVPKLMLTFQNLALAIECALNENDAVWLRREAHNLKGAALNFGVNCVALLACDIELAAKTGDAAAARTSLETLREVLQKLSIVSE